MKNNQSADFKFFGTAGAKIRILVLIVEKAMISFNDMEFKIRKLDFLNVWSSYDEKSTATDEKVKKSFQVVRILH